MKKRYLFDEELLKKVEQKDELDFNVQVLNRALTELKKEFENGFFIDSKIEEFKDESKVEELGYQLKRLSNDFKVYANEEDKAFLLITNLKDFDKNEITEIKNIEELKMDEQEVEDSNSEEIDKQGQTQANQFTDEQASKLLQLIDGENLDALLALIADMKQEKEMDENETIDSKEESKEDKKEDEDEEEKLIDTKQKTNDSFASFNTIYNASNEKFNEEIEDEISNAWKARKFK